jgi:hypothetical protein
MGRPTVTLPSTACRFHGARLASTLALPRGRRRIEQARVANPKNAVSAVVGRVSDPAQPPLQPNRHAKHEDDFAEATAAFVGRRQQTVRRCVIVIQRAPLLHGVEKRRPDKSGAMDTEQPT